MEARPKRKKKSEVGTWKRRKQVRSTEWKKEVKAGSQNLEDWELGKGERGEKVEKLRLFIPLGGDSRIPQDHSPSLKQANQTKGQSLRINFYIQE